MARLAGWTKDLGLIPAPRLWAGWHCLRTSPWSTVKLIVLRRGSINLISLVLRAAFRGCHFPQGTDWDCAHRYQTTLFPEILMTYIGQASVAVRADRAIHEFLVGLCCDLCGVNSWTPTPRNESGHF